MIRSILLWYFLWYDPRYPAMKVSEVYINEIDCEIIRQEQKKKLKDLNEFQRAWISPGCELKTTKN